jgi:hypothetical protein
VEFWYYAVRDVDGYREYLFSNSFSRNEGSYIFLGQTPFWADNHSDMYVRVLQDELQFPDDRAMDQDTKSLIRGVSHLTSLFTTLVSDTDNVVIAATT